MDPGFGGGGQPLPIPGQPALAPELRKGPLHDPALGQHLEPAGHDGRWCVGGRPHPAARPLDDQEPPAEPFVQPSAKALVAHVGEPAGDVGKCSARPSSTPSAARRSCASAAWMRACRTKPWVSTISCRLRPLIRLPPSYPRSPPISLVLAVWLSMIAAVGRGSCPARSRARSRRASLTCRPGPARRHRRN